MLEKFALHFASPGAPELEISADSDATRKALVAVFLSAARADGAFTSAEYEIISRILENKLQVPKSQIDNFLKEPESTDALSQAVTEICTKFNEAQREQLLVLAWAILGADQLALEKEGQFAAKLRHDLKLSLEQAVQARKLAEGVKLDGFKAFIEASPAMIEGVREWWSKHHPAK